MTVKRNWRIEKTGLKKPLAKMARRFISSCEKEFNAGSAEGRYLPMALDAAVPLWAMQFQKMDEEERREEFKRITADGDFCLRMEHLLHKGPKKGDSARAFNDTAKAIALLAFAPGGVHLFGRHWRFEKVRVPA